MKIVLILLLGAGITSLWGLSVFLAFGAGAKKTADLALRKAGLTKARAELLSRAVVLLRRLDQLTDLDGALAGDVLSPATKKQVAKWVTDYRKEIEQG